MIKILNNNNNKKIININYNNNNSSRNSMIKNTFNIYNKFN